MNTNDVFDPYVAKKGDSIILSNYSEFQREDIANKLRRRGLYIRATGMCDESSDGCVVDSLDANMDRAEQAANNEILSAGY